MAGGTFVNVTTKYVLKATFSYPWNAGAVAPLKKSLNSHDDDYSENVT